jgi:chromosome segregation ATPase
MSFSNQKKKKVHYESGTKWSTKGWKHRAHRSSRDSGVGSSSASDRASLGTADESPFTHEQIEDQRHILSSVHEALDAANEKIRGLEASHFKLNTALTESTKENRLLKREKEDLFNKVEDLLRALSEERKMNERLRRETSPRTGERRTTPPRREAEIPRTYVRVDERPQASSARSDRRSSYQMPTSPATAQPNSFAPLPTRTPSVTYAPAGSVVYAPSTVSYASAPVYPTSLPSPREHYSDGKYHLSPL